jgi:hypothetical protein
MCTETLDGTTGIVNVGNHWARYQVYGEGGPKPLSRGVTSPVGSDLLFLGYIKSHLVGKRYATDADVNRVVIAC